MRCPNLYSIAGVGAATALAFVVAAYDQTHALGQPPGDVNRETRSADSKGPETPPFHEQQVFAWHAYLKAIEGFKSGEIKDPEVVYRWSKRLMKAEQKLKMAEPAEETHLRRMSELARIPEATTKDGSDQELKYWATQYYEHEAKEIVKAAKQAKLAKSAAKSDNAASSPHDAAIAVAEAYLTAALKGDTEAAAKLAVPESLAASRRLMENVKDKVRLEPDEKPFRVSSVQDSPGAGEITVAGEIHLADKTQNNRGPGHFSVVLKQTNGGFLVTNFAVHESFRRGDFGTPSRTSPLNQSRRTPIPDSAPDTKTREIIKVFVLKHAQAAELKQTLSQLLELDNPDLRVAVDARTNRLLVHGTADRVEVVQALIIQLDEPSAEIKTERSQEGVPPELKP